MADKELLRLQQRSSQWKVIQINDPLDRLEPEKRKEATEEWARKREEYSWDLRMLFDFLGRFHIKLPNPGHCKDAQQMVREVDIMLDYPHPVPVYAGQQCCVLEDGTKYDLYASHTRQRNEHAKERAMERAKLPPVAVEPSPGIPADVQENIKKWQAEYEKERAKCPVEPPAQRPGPPDYLKEHVKEWVDQREKITRSYLDFLHFTRRVPWLRLITDGTGGHFYKRVRELDFLMGYPDPAPQVNGDGKLLSNPKKRCFLYPSHREAWKKKRAEEKEKEKSAKGKRKAEETPADPPKEKKKKQKKEKDPGEKKKEKAQVIA